MASISFQFVPLRENVAQVSVPQAAPTAPQWNTAQVDAAQHQDTVTLVGRTAENQQISQDRGQAQFRDDTAFYLAERQSFRAANGSQGQQAPKLPVQITDEATLNNAHQPDVATGNAPKENANTPAGGSATDAETEAAAAPATIGNANGASAASANSVSSSAAPNLVSATPQQQLEQLDQTLQEIGINPQSIALFNRMAMLLYANDPAALKVLVQNLQSTVPQTASPAAASNAGADASQTLVANTQAQTPSINSPPETRGSTSAPRFPPGRFKRCLSAAE